MGVVAASATRESVEGNNLLLQLLATLVQPCDDNAGIGGFELFESLCDLNDATQPVAGVGGVQYRVIHYPLYPMHPYSIVLCPCAPSAAPAWIPGR